MAFKYIVASSLWWGVACFAFFLYSPEFLQFLSTAPAGEFGEATKKIAGLIFLKEQNAYISFGNLIGFKCTGKKSLSWSEGVSWKGEGEE